MLAFFFTRDNSTRAMWEAYMQFSHCDENWQVAWLRSQKNPQTEMSVFYFICSHIYGYGCPCDYFDHSRILSSK